MNQFGLAWYNGHGVLPRGMASLGIGQAAGLHRDHLSFALPIDERGKIFWSPNPNRRTVLAGRRALTESKFWKDKVLHPELTLVPTGELTGGVGRLSSGVVGRRERVEVEMRCQLCCETP